MKARVGAAVICLVALAGCSTDEICTDACAIFSECNEWSRAPCFDSCKAQGDWSDAYLDCLEDHRDDCNLDDC